MRVRFARFVAVGWMGFAVHVAHESMVRTLDSLRERQHDR